MQIIELVKTFKDRDSLYLLLEFLQAGDMFGLLLRQGGTLDLWAAQYYSAIVTSALEYLHELNVVYRDLKVRLLRMPRSAAWSRDPFTAGCA